jgi:uncharacterized protein YegP (UPF0339 family)
MSGTFELKKAAHGQFYFNLKSTNGHTILTSEFFKAKVGAHTGIETVKKSALQDAHYERKISKANQPFFVLKAPDGEPIGKSEMYSTDEAMEQGILSVKSHAPNAMVIDRAP